MADSAHITRRAALVGALVSTAALGAAVATVTVAEERAPAEEIRDLSRRIAELLSQQPEGFFSKVEITAGYVLQSYAL